MFMSGGEYAGEVNHLLHYVEQFMGMLLIACMLLCELKVALTCEPWAFGNMALFNVQACTIAPGPGDFSGSSNNDGNQTTQ